MKTMQLREAKAQLSAVVDDAMAGEPTTITRHGTPVAIVVSLEEWNSRSVVERPSVIDALLAFPGGVEFERDHTPPREIDL
jgi:prevent-host-death family protein